MNTVYLNNITKEKVITSVMLVAFFIVGSLLLKNYVIVDVNIILGIIITPYTLDFSKNEYSHKYLFPTLLLLIASFYIQNYTLLFLILFYKLPGLLASFALLIYMLILFSIIKITGATLTLAGIGGIILSIGMAIDGNILIFSRMREELEDGSDIYSAIEKGVERAWPSIRDGNVTTLIVAIILYSLGTSFVKAFAFTLIIGILVSLFSAMVVTRIFLLFFARGFAIKLKRIWS